MVPRVLQGWGKLHKVVCIHPLQCSCLENPRDGGAWWAALYGVAQGRTRLKPLSSSSSSSLYSSPMELIIFTNFFFPFLPSLPSFLFLAFFFHFMFLRLILCLYNSKKKASSFKAFIPVFKLNCSLPDCPHLSETPTHVWSDREKACTFITHSVRTPLFHWTMPNHCLSIVFHQPPQNLFSKHYCMCFYPQMYSLRVT